MPSLDKRWPIINFEKCLEASKKPPKSLKSKEILGKGKFPVIDQGEQFISGFTNEESILYKGPLPVVIFGDHTRRFKFIEFCFAVGAQGTHILRPKKTIDPKFFFFYLRSLNLESQGYSRHYRFLKESDVPIPCLDEQRRIVVKLEKLLEKVETCQKRLDKIPTLLKRFRQSILSAACSGRLTADWREKFLLQSTGKNNEIPGGWTATTLGQVGKWSTGGTPARHKAEFFGIGVPWVKSGDLKDGPILRTDESITKKGLENSNAKLMPRGTISLALYGATIGRVGLMTFPAATNQACANVVPDNGIVLTTYLFFLLLSQRQQFIEMGQGGAQPNISQGIIRSYPINLPPLNEQTEIVNRIASIFQVSDQIEARYQSAQACVDKLTQSILAKAFRGELVPQIHGQE